MFRVTWKWSSHMFAYYVDVPTLREAEVLREVSAGVTYSTINRVS